MACRSSAPRPNRSTWPKTASVSSSWSKRLGLAQPPNRTARNPDEAIALARQIGYPLVVRPSYVLGGRAMEVVHSDADLSRYIRDAVKVSNDSPVLLDRFLDNAVEVDIDVIADKDGNVLIGGVMEHIEEAGVHSGDSVLLAAAVLAIAEDTGRAARTGRRPGQGAGRDRTDEHPVRHPADGDGEDRIFLLEVNPRASRTVPFVSKATGARWRRSPRAAWPARPWPNRA